MMEKRDKDLGGGVAPANSPFPPVMGQNEEGNSVVSRAEPIARLVPMTFCIAALVIMLKNSQTTDYGPLSYSDLGAFRYLVHANGICTGYSLLSAIIIAMPSPSTMSQAWALFFLDQVLTYLILGAGTVSAEVLYLARNGDIAITWSAACGSFGGFCHKATASVIITFVAVACYAVLSLISSYKLFSKFDPPIIAYPGKNNVEVDSFQA